MFLVLVVVVAVVFSAVVTVFTVGLVVSALDSLVVMEVLVLSAFVCAVEVRYDVYDWWNANVCL